MLPDHIKARINKILALAGNNPEPHEAALALQRAKELMAQYAVSEVDLLDICEKRLPFNFAKSELYSHELLSIVKKFCGVNVLFIVGQKSILIIGPRHRVEHAEYVLAFLSRIVRKEHTRKSAQIDDIPRHWTKIRQKVRALINEYMLGYVVGIDDSLNKVSASTPLTESEKQAIEQALSDFTVGKQKHKARDTNFSAQAEGYQAGKRVQVHTAVSGQQTLFLE